MGATKQQVKSQYHADPDMSVDSLGENAADDLLQFVICRIGSEEFAVDVLSVQEINRIVEVTRVPKTPPMWRGSSIFEAALFPCWICENCSASAGLNRPLRLELWWYRCRPAWSD